MAKRVTYWLPEGIELNAEKHTAWLKSYGFKIEGTVKVEEVAPIEKTFTVTLRTPPRYVGTWQVPDADFVASRVAWPSDCTVVEVTS